MPVAVDADLVAGGGDLGRERPAAARPARRRGRTSRVAPARSSCSSTAGVPSRMRPVVEGERDPAAARQPAAGCRTAPRRGGTTGAAAGAHQARAAPSERATRPSRSMRRRRLASTNDAADGSVREARRRRAPPLERARRRAARSAAGVVGDLGEAEAAERRGCAPRTWPAPPAVRDRRAAAHHRLEHGQPAGRVDERVGGGEPVGHLVGEPLDAHARRRRRSRCSQLRAELVVAAAQADDLVDARRRRAPRATAPSTSPTPQPPPETSTIFAARGRARARGARRRLRARREELRRGEAVDAVHRRRRRRRSAHLGDRLGCVTRWRSAPGVAQ